MRAAHFERGSRVGCGIVYREIMGVRTKVEVDPMVPEAVGGRGRQAARLPGHSREVARKARGLEAALVDKVTPTIAAPDPPDQQSFAVALAGPAALLIAKLHEIAERVSEQSQRRLDDKNALNLSRRHRLVRARPEIGDTHPLSTLRYCLRHGFPAKKGERPQFLRE